MTAEDNRREYEIADREALRAELAAARDALRRAEEQLAEAKEREAKLLDLAQSASVLMVDGSGRIAGLPLAVGGALAVAGFAFHNYACHGRNPH